MHLQQPKPGGHSLPQEVLGLLAPARGCGDAVQDDAPPLELLSVRPAQLLVQVVLEETEEMADDSLAAVGAACR